MRWILLVVGLLAGAVAGAGTWRWVGPRLQADELERGFVVHPAPGGGGPVAAGGGGVVRPPSPEARAVASGGGAVEHPPAGGAGPALAARATRDARPEPAGGESARPDVAVLRALAPWLERGRAREAAAALRQVGAAALAAEVEAVDGLRRAGHAALLAGDLALAEARWGEALEREAAWGAEPSLPAREMRQRLAAALHARASAHEARDQHESAFRLWRRAAALDPTHLEALGGLQRLELRAARALAAGASCEALAEVVATTRQESPTHLLAVGERQRRCGGGPLSAIPPG